MNIIINLFRRFGVGTKAWLEREPSERRANQPTNQLLSVVVLLFWPSSDAAGWRIVVYKEQDRGRRGLNRPERATAESLLLLLLLVPLSHHHNHRHPHTTINNGSQTPPLLTWVFIHQHHYHSLAILTISSFTLA
ncbi:hypothetical protein Pmani_033379 [Petrolisthes manimaculis]|uniref:Uncharacterized protein n=1 Tax=Petrolisthes manimaculis TaxID=1843537 RepID=A0AAE1TQQ4_9EUCA|nr:hypothetical protein Pmani_033379 [Petrolisthes manimaculis]